jgi:protein-tyrosine phosphatase
MIDFHTHILPGIDDGSRDIQMTEQMLEKEAASGVTIVYATPHFYAHRTGVSGFLAKRDASYRKVRELLETRDDLPSVKAGAEVYYFRGMGRAEHTPGLCVEGTDILLLEMPFEQWTEEVY